MVCRRWILALLSVGCSGDGRPDKLPNDTFVGGELSLARDLPRPQDCVFYVAIPGGGDLRSISVDALEEAPVSIQRDLGSIQDDIRLFWLTDEEVEPYAEAFDREWQAWIRCEDADGADAWGAEGGEEAVPFDVPSDGLNITVDRLSAPTG